MKILANDGISASGKTKLEEYGFEVLQTRVAQEQLAQYINDNDIPILVVGGRTLVNKDFLEICNTLKLVAHSGSRIDNIDVAFAEKKGITVVNALEAAARSVAELAFAHLAGSVRYLHDANREMPLAGDSKFNQLKSAYTGGIELQNKTLGILGLDNTAQHLASIALGVGMRVLYHDPKVDKTRIMIPFYTGDAHQIELLGRDKDTILRESDFISLHMPLHNNYILDGNEFQIMSSGTGIINVCKGRLINEVALLEALNSGKLAFAGLDVFENEPRPSVQILMHPKISLSPHLGATTYEGLERIGKSLADQIIAFYNN